MCPLRALRLLAVDKVLAFYHVVYACLNMRKQRTKKNQNDSRKRLAAYIFDSERRIVGSCFLVVVDRCVKLLVNRQKKVLRLTFNIIWALTAFRAHTERATPRVNTCLNLHIYIYGKYIRFVPVLHFSFAVRFM